MCMSYNDFFQGMANGRNFSTASTPAGSPSASGASTPAAAAAAPPPTRAGAPGGVGTAVQTTGLLTPAFAPGTPGYKQLTGQ